MESARAPGVHIPVANNDLVFLTFVAEQLGEYGLPVLIAGGVEAALQVLGEERPALVLTNIPKAPRDGYALLGEVCERSPRVPVVLMSAPGNAERASQEAAGFLQKPFSERQVLDAVASALRDYCATAWARRCPRLEPTTTWSNATRRGARPHAASASSAQGPREGDVLAAQFVHQVAQERSPIA